ncbi:MAG: hypothetical protein DRJ45_07570 [Thermoprotei archaeon]|nr:MAG: hypothetical protein DRJ45_07570 [Thermoprotei archaeon]
MKNGRKMRIEEWVAGAFIVIVGVYVSFKIIEEFCKLDPQFCTIGGSLLTAFIIGAILYLKYGWKS